MKTTKYTRLFISDCGDKYTLTVNCFSFIQAFILLTAKAINSGKHYQLDNITDEHGSVRNIDSILKLSKLIK